MYALSVHLNPTIPYVGPIAMCGGYFEIVIAIFKKGTRAGTAPKAWSLRCPF